MTGLRWRSVLFTPADRPERVRRLAATGADVTVLDLEDAVPVGEKEAARAQVGDFAAALRAANPDLVVLVRVNPVDAPWFTADVAAAAGAGVAGLVLPKASEPGDAAAADDAWADGHGAGSPVLLAGIETAAGVEAVPDLLRSGRFAAAYFGAEDYIADLGGRRTDGGTEVLYARSRVAMAAALGRIDAVDQVVTSYRDADAFTADAGLARDLGYRGKLCIHPDQVPLARAAFTPTAVEVASARALLQALHDAGGGVATFEGRMIDAPAVLAAERTLALADY